MSNSPGTTGTPSADLSALDELEAFAKSMNAEPEPAPAPAPQRTAARPAPAPAPREDIEFGKSFQLPDGGEVVDAAPMLKSILATLDELTEKVDRILKADGTLAKGLATTGRMVVGVREVVDSFASSGRGRRSDVAAPGATPGGEPAGAQKFDAGALLMKSLELAEAGKLSAAHVSEIEMYVRNGKVPPPQFHRALGITVAS